MSRSATDFILYEQPLNEYMRLALRLEYLFQHMDVHQRSANPLDTHHALSAMIDIINLLDRPDLKGKLLQEYKRYEEQLERWRNIKGVCTNTLGKMQAELNTIFHRLEQTNGKLGQRLRDNDFLNHIRQHMLSPGSTSQADTPAYHYWLQQPFNTHQLAFETWNAELVLARDAMGLLLQLSRNSGVWRDATTQEGLHQIPLDPLLPSQLVQIQLAKDSPFFPEISAGKHRVYIRLLTLENTTLRSITYSDAVLFRLKIGVI